MDKSFLLMAATATIIFTTLSIAQAQRVTFEGFDNLRPSGISSSRPSIASVSRPSGVFSQSQSGFPVSRPSAGGSSGSSCDNRIRHELWRDTRGVSHNYFFSWQHGPTSNLELDWAGVRDYCRRNCMEPVSIESPAENDFVKRHIARGRVRYIWTSGMKSPGGSLVNGWFWSGSGVSIGATNNRANGDWSHTGGYGMPQPDNRELPQGFDESCLSILNNFYNDGIHWHDVACYHKKPFICEDTN